MKNSNPLSSRHINLGSKILLTIAIGSVLALTGCAETACSGCDTRVTGGAGGVDGGGTGGSGEPVQCLGPEDCDDGNECTVAQCTDEVCSSTPAADGMACTDGECRQGTCTPVFPCTEQGVRDAIAEGGGPHLFGCDGPTTVLIGSDGSDLTITNDVILDGEGRLTLKNNRAAEVPVLSVGSATVELRGMTFERGRDGAIRNLFGGMLTLVDCAVVGSSTNDNGGGIQNAATLTLINSTVSDNGAGFGGAIENSRTLTLINSTISGNTASNFASSGIINIGTLSTVTLVNSTVSNNISFDRPGSLTASNSILAGDCGFLGDMTVTSEGGNIESPGDTCGFDQPTDQVNVSAGDLALAPLQDNGGPTQTHGLLPSSVAIDQIAAASCEVDEDQLGVPRPQGPLCDVGAFELEP